MFAFPHDITYQGSPSLRHTAGPAGQTCLPRLPSCPSTTAPGRTPPTAPLHPPGVRGVSHAALLRPSQTPAQKGRVGGWGGGRSESEEGLWKVSCLGEAPSAAATNVSRTNSKWHVECFLSVQEKNDEGVD